MRITKKKLAAVAVGTAVAVTGATVAFAYFTSSGEGSGTATTSDGVNVSVSGGLNPSNALEYLAPGYTTPDITFTVSNVGNAEAAFISTVTASVTVTGGTDSDLDDDGCNPSDYTIDGEDPTDPVALDWDEIDLAAGATSSSTLSLQFNNTGDNQDDCKNAVVTLNYAAS